jgi:hypothetical protein
MSKAAGDEVVATATVEDIVAGSALRFDPKRARAQGDRRPRRLYAVT